MLFNNLKNYKYEPFPFDSRFLMFKFDNTWELCILDSNEEYPTVIGSIGLGLRGPLENASNLGWYLSPKYQNQGIMSKFLSLYLSEMKPQQDGFAVVILNDNTPSLKLALKNGFIPYKETENKTYLRKFKS